MKVFCIGLSRTGTQSLAKALKTLGYNSSHHPPLSFRFDICSRFVLRILKKMGVNNYYPYILYRFGTLYFKHDPFTKFDAFSDTPIARFYKRLDRQYPNSKFILTVRDIHSWLKSCKRLFASYDFKGGHALTRLHLDLYGRTVFDRKKFTKAYDRHVRDVYSYFKQREKDLLVINICKGEGWEKLCSFLNKPIPEEPFPNKDNVLREKAKK